MQSTDLTWNRREFLTSTAVIATSAVVGGRARLGQTAPEAKLQIALGMDNFSIRAHGWKAPRLIDYAASQGLDTILMSDLDVYESHDAAYLKGLRDRADRLGLFIHAGTGGICPTSSRAITKYGSSEDHLALAIRVAAALGSPVIRCYMGSSADREGDGGIWPHVESTVKVCKAVRTRALDAGVKIAIENHAGDMQAWELVELIEAAGKDYVGATMDSGNAVWAIEDPVVTLEVLGPYAVTTGFRDCAVWEEGDDLVVQWTAMGDGRIDWSVYIARFAELCPGVPIQLEIITGGRRKFPYRTKAFWENFPDAKASQFVRFLAMARHGAPPATRERPQAASRQESERLWQRSELERSIRFCRETLGLGRPTPPRS